MAWTVVLENEDKSVVSAVSDDIDADLSYDLTQCKLLKYLDPYGDTIFNQLQMDDLIQDIEFLCKSAKNSILEEVILLAKHCKAEPHTYLCFYGN